MKRLLALLLLIPSIALAANSATITWTVPTLRTDGSTITGALTYSLYQGATGAETLSVTGLTGTTFTVSTGLVSGSTVCWTMTATEAGGGTSAFTNEVCKTFPLAPPAAPTLSVK